MAAGEVAYLCSQGVPDLLERLLHRLLKAQPAEPAAFAARFLRRAIDTRAAAAAGAPHLVLHFDVNRTVIMLDSATGKGVDEIVSGVVACGAWGGGRPWELRHPCPSATRPAPDLVSYVEHLEKEHPGREGIPERVRLVACFTEPGQPGARLRGDWERLSDLLRIPASVRGTPAAAACGLTGESLLLLPSFFEMVLELRRRRRSFTIVFRTFGTDLVAVSQEWNAFCEGRHPMYPAAPRFDGSDGGGDYRVNLAAGSDTCGTFYRGADGDALAVGTIAQPKGLPPGLEFYDSMEGVRVVRDAPGEVSEMWRWLHARTAAPGALALRDYYPWWAAHGRRGEAGKRLLLNVAGCHRGPLAGRRHEMFFDDHIAPTNAQIVDARYRLMPARVPWTPYLYGTHLCRAEPLESIADPEFFVRKIDEMECSMRRRLRAQMRLRALMRKAILLRSALSDMLAALPPDPRRPPGGACPWWDAAHAEARLVETSGVDDEEGGDPGGAG